MKALRWHGANDLRLDEITTPIARPGRALIRVERVGLCGTDVEEYIHGPLDIPVGAPHPRSGHQAPLTPGHEVVGVVVECPGDENWVGRRVIPDVVEGCGLCWWCLRHEEGLCRELVVLGQHAPGGLAHFMDADAKTLVTVPDHLSADIAAFAEPTSVAVRAVAKAGDLRGATVAVVGAGVVGNLIAQVARAHGCTVIAVDPAEHRQALARETGAHHAVGNRDGAQALLNVLTQTAGADVVFECAGRAPAFEDSVALTRRGGTTILVGLNAEDPTLPWRDVVLSEKRLIGTAAHIWDRDVSTAVQMLASGIVDPAPLLSQVVGLDGVADALDRLATPNTLAKVLVDPWKEPQ